MPDAPAFVAVAADKLRELLRRADYQTPQGLIAWLLTGPWQGRARLVERLVDDAGRLGFLIRPDCSYVAAKFAENPDWAAVKA